MKIPQRQDQVQLAAPQTQPGKAVQPVEGSLGDSYITAMRGMSKSFKEISDLQLDLSKNALEGQLNAFDIYVDARTKQYNQEVAKATTEEQIGELFEKYKVDIAENGNNVLGQDIYNNWELKKGGAQFAGAQYTGTLASAQLQIQKNKQLFKDSAESLNVLAGTSANAEERAEYVKKFNQLVQDNIANGTLSEEDGKKETREFNYNLATTLVVDYMGQNPSKCADKLLHDEKFAPEIPFPQRLQFAQEAMRIASSRNGTAGKINPMMEYWKSLYWEKDPEKMTKANALAGEIHDIFANNQNEAKKLLAKVLNVKESDISYDDVEKALSEMDSVINRQNQDLQAEFNSIEDKNIKSFNRLKTLEGKDKQGNPTAEILKGPKLELAFREGKLKKNISQDNQLIDTAYTFYSLFKNPKLNMLTSQNQKTASEVRGNAREAVKLYVIGIRNKKEITEAQTGFEQGMRNALQDMGKAMDKIPQGDKQITDNGLEVFVDNLWRTVDKQDLVKMFDPSVTVNKEDNDKLMGQVRAALRTSNLPEEYVSFLFKTSRPQTQSRASKFLNLFKESTDNPDSPLTIRSF